MVHLFTERICAEASVLHTESVWGTSETRGYRHGHRPSLSVVYPSLDDLVMAINLACTWYTHMQMPDTGGTLNCRPQYMSSVWNTLNLNHNRLVPNCTLCIRSNFNSVLSLLFKPVQYWDVRLRLPVVRQRIAFRIKVTMTYQSQS